MAVSAPFNNILTAIKVGGWVREFEPQIVVRMHTDGVPNISNAKIGLYVGKMAPDLFFAIAGRV